MLNLPLFTSHKTFFERRLTAGLLIRLQNEEITALDCLSLLTGKSKERIYRDARSEEIFSPLIEQLNQVKERRDKEQLNFNLSFPKSSVKTIEIQLKSDINDLTYGFWIYAEGLIRADVKQFNEKYPDQDFMPRLETAVSILAHAVYCSSLQSYQNYDFELSESFLKSVLDLPAVRVAPLAWYYYNQILDLLERESMRQPSKQASTTAKYAEIAKRAGVSRFDKYGAHNDINTLAGDDVLKWSEVLKLNLFVAKMKLAMIRDQAEYESLYNEILISSSG